MILEQSRPLAGSVSRALLPCNGTVRIGRISRLPCTVRLRELRRRAGLSQTDLAVRTRIPQSHLSAIECGKRRAGPARALRIAEALGAVLGVTMSVEEVFP